MEAQVVLTLLGIFLITAVFVLRPFAGAEKRERVGDKIDSAWLAERERLLKALQELDFDHELGKMTEEDYASQRVELVRLGGLVMEKIDQQVAIKEPLKSPKKAEVPAGVLDEEIEEMIARRRSLRKEQTGGFCPKCGKAIIRSDRFCPKCGQEIRPAVKK